MTSRDVEELTVTQVGKMLPRKFPRCYPGCQHAALDGIGRYFADFTLIFLAFWISLDLAGFLIGGRVLRIKGLSC